MIDNGGISFVYQDYGKFTGKMFSPGIYTARVKNNQTGEIGQCGVYITETLPLNSYHPGCNHTDKSTHPDCVAAVHRACLEKGLNMALPQEMGPTAIGTGCFNARSYGDVPIQTLKSFHSGCDSTSKSQTSDCAAAINRFCQAGGHGVAGLNAGEPQEVGGSALLVGCFLSDEDIALGKGDVYTIHISELKSLHPGCSDPSLMQGKDCTAALHRACNRRGFDVGASKEVMSNGNIGVNCFNVDFYGDFRLLPGDI